MKLCMGSKSTFLSNINLFSNINKFIHRELKYRNQSKNKIISKKVVSVSYIKMIKSLNICFLLFVSYMRIIGSILIGLYYATWLCFV